MKIFSIGVSKKQKGLILKNLGSLGYFYDDFKLMIQYIDDICNAPVAGRTIAFKNFEMACALNNIDIDLSSFYTIEHYNDFLNSREFRTIFNQLYTNLDDNQKRNFCLKLSQDNCGRPIYFDTNEEQMKAHLKMFTAIDDEKKYDYVPINILAGALEFDCIQNDKQKVDVLLKMYRKNPRDSYVPNYLDGISNGSKKMLDISLPELMAILEEKGIEEDSVLTMGILGAISPDEIKRFLVSRPDRFMTSINVLSDENVEDVLTIINDQEYSAQLLLELNTDIKKIASFFPHIEDEYIRAQIILAHTDNYRVISTEEAIRNIREFLKIKEQFLTLSDSERVELLSQFGFEQRDDEASISRKNRNQIKQSLLQYIPGHEDRMKVIETFERGVSEEIFPYENLTRQMILEFVEDKFHLTQEQTERLYMALNSNDMLFSSYLESGINGEAAYHDKDIVMSSHLLKQKKNCILDILHERAHTFSNSDYLISAYNVGDTFEEGMADTFSELVANYYFKKHPRIEFNGEIFAPDLPLTTQSSYYFANGWVKSMLYPLEGSNMDIRAVQEFLLGDKNVFFDMCMGENFSQKFPHDYLGNPQSVEFTEGELVDANGQSYIELNPESLYLIKNDRIAKLSEMAKYELNNMGKK